MDIEPAVLQPFAESHRELGVDMCICTTFRTDEGLMSPYGVMDQTINIVYEVETFD